MENQGEADFFLLHLQLSLLEMSCCSFYRDKSSWDPTKIWNLLKRADLLMNRFGSAEPTGLSWHLIQGSSLLNPDWKDVLEQEGEAKWVSKVEGRSNSEQMFLRKFDYFLWYLFHIYREAVTHITEELEMCLEDVMKAGYVHLDFNNILQSVYGWYESGLGSHF